MADSTIRHMLPATFMLASLAWSGQSLAALAAPGISVTTQGNYQSAASGPSTATAGNPGSATQTTIVGPGGGAPVGSSGLAPTVEWFNDSIAMGRAQLPGTLGSYSHAGGFSPGFSPPGNVSAEATARFVTQWVVTSNDPTVTAVGIDVLAFFDGTLYTGDFAGVGAGQLAASVSAEMNADTAAGNLYNFNANATLDNQLGVTASGNWVSSITTASSASGGERLATVVYNDFFQDAFVVNVGEVFSWEVALNTSANAIGPFELWAVADFFNTGGFTLSIDTPGATLTEVAPVPLPPALPLLVGAVAMLGMRGRGRATVH